MFQFIFKFIKRYKNYLALLITLPLVTQIGSMLIPYLNGIYVDVLLSTKSVEDIIHFAELLIGIGVVEGILSLIYSIYKKKIGNILAFEIQSDIICHIQKISFLKIQKFNYNYLVKRILDDSNIVVSFFLENFISIFLQGILFMGFLSIIYTINIKIFILSLIFIPIYLISYYLTKNPLFNATKKYQEGSNFFFSKETEQIQLVKEIKFAARYEENNFALRGYFQNFLSVFMNYTKLSFVFASIDSFISLIFHSIVLIIGGIAVHDHKITIGQYSIIATYFTMMISCVRYYAQLGKEYQNTMVSYRRLQELYHIEIEHNGTVLLDEVDSIKIRDMSFYYEKGKNIYDKANFAFQKGKIYILLGHNGAGKSTLLNIIIGILNENISGRLTYNEINIHDIDMNTLRHNNITVIFPNYRYPDKTIRSLLHDFCPDVNVFEEIKKYGLIEMFDNDEFEISAYMDVNINTLSDGQKQKINILLSVLKNADVLIWDEPTSNIDEKSKSVIKKYIVANKQSKIIIISTNDPCIEDIGDVVFDFR